MHLSESFAAINWLSVLVSTIVAFIIGGLWYSPVLFGKMWQAELKLSDKEMKESNMVMIFGSTFILNFIAATVLDLFIGKESNLIDGLIAGSFVGLTWIATSIGINYLFSRKSLKLFFIDSGYFVFFFAVMGAILGAW